MSAPDFTLKHQREQFKAQGKFHTPPELARFLRELIPGTPTRVYDPTCGAGSLLAEFPEAQLFGQDIDVEAVAAAQDRFGDRFHGVVGDVLTAPAWLDEQFEAIVANPPFSIKWDPTKATDERFLDAPTVPTKGRADFAFLIHIMHMLADGGTAAVLQFPGVLYRGQREATLRRWMVEQGWVHRVIHIPGDTFVDTSISTCCLVLSKTPAEQIMFEDREQHLSTSVPVADVLADEGCQLSPNRYVRAPEPASPPVDPVQLEQSARHGALRRIRAELEFSRMVTAIEGWHDFPEFCQQVRGVVDDVESSPHPQFEREAA